MIKSIYILAWLLLVGSITGSVVNGTLTDLGLLAHALIALGLVYALALWAVLTNPGDPRHERVDV